jgi:ABC-type molybdate transport system permease subunit
MMVLKALVLSWVLITLPILAASAEEASKLVPQAIGKSAATEAAVKDDGVVRIAMSLSP